MRERAVDRLAHALQQRAEERGAVEARAEGERVREQPDQILGLVMRPSRDRGPDDDVVLPRVPLQQELEGREQDGEDVAPTSRPNATTPAAAAALRTTGT